MKNILKIEEVAQFLLGFFLFSQLQLSWWWFVGLFFAPDIGMLGYLFGNKTGAFCYNIFHHKGLAIGLFLIGIYVDSIGYQLAGIVLFSHASFDRVFGFGLKQNEGFKFTHLGNLK